MNGPLSEDGVLLTSKSPGITSHDVVERVRRTPLAAGRKVGHAGTLDPFATGLLLILVGKATRVQRYFMNLPKTYRARARFGARSDTGDPTGVIAPGEGEATRDAVEAALPSLTGEIEQRVPLASAVKVGGERLYRKARRGEQFETPVRSVVVKRLELLDFDAGEQAATLELDCSSGTYVRQLVADLGEAVGCGAYCERLERLAIGPFRLEDASDELIPLGEALAFLPERPLDAEEARRARHGRTVTAGQTPASGAVRLTADRELIAVAERSGDTLKPVTVLA
jgi:tRNA pseudouridine55 synthase